MKRYPRDTQALSLSKSALAAFYINFSDLLLLMLVFFVMLVGMSKVDLGSFEKLRSGVTGSQKGTLVELAAKLKHIAKAHPTVEVSLAEDGLRLDLDTRALFDKGSAALKFDAIGPLRPFLMEILATPYRIDVEGHTDDLALYKKVGNELETNWSLSGKRAAAVLHLLLEQGYSRQRLRVIGYGSTKPKAKIEGLEAKNLDQARQKNRRVTLLVR